MNEMVIAYHEAAHAVIRYRQVGFVGGYVSIVPAAHSLGRSFDDWSDSGNAEHIEAKIVSNYAGGHAQRRVDASVGTTGCESDEENARCWLARCGWEQREVELRERSLALVKEHWAEICAVADELLRVRVLHQTEIELLADAAAGGPNPYVDLAEYRMRGAHALKAWRTSVTANEQRM